MKYTRCSVQYEVYGMECTINAVYGVELKEYKIYMYLVVYSIQCVQIPHCWITAPVRIFFFLS